MTPASGHGLAEAPLPWLLVDAFVGSGARGNPAAVVLLPGPAPAPLLQAIAAELAQAESSFLVPLGPGRWALRWFTPRVEALLCGHATLAAAATLGAWGLAEPGQPLRFETCAGPLWASLRAPSAWAAPWGPPAGGAVRPGLGPASRGEVGWPGALPWGQLPDLAAPGLGRQVGVAMDFPSELPEEAPMPGPLAELLGELPVQWVGRNRLAWMVVVAEEAALRAWRPPLGALEAWGEELLLTARGTGPWAAVSRYFAPACGIPEDQVTGSAHAALGPWWASRLGLEALPCWQASERGGAVAVWPWGTGRVGLGGLARVVASGHLQGLAGWAGGASPSAGQGG